MTESDWLSCSDPTAMLAFLSGRGAGGRKLRLFAAACSRRAWPLIDDLGRAAVELAEDFADGRADAGQLRAARLACKGSGGQSCWYAAATDPAVAARNAATGALGGATSPDRERLAQADLLRCIFGNSFAPAALDPAWRSDVAITLARQMYETRDFSPMPVLADALQHEGCGDEHVLSHCRGAGPHARGCWVIDLVLGKS